MNLFPISLPGGSGETQQILAGHQSIDAAGLWVLLSTTSSRTLVYCTSSSADSRFVLPYDFVYLGSSSCGKLFFLAENSASIQPLLYVLQHECGSGITVTSSIIDSKYDHWEDLLSFLSPRDGFAVASTLHDSPLLNDNALSASTLASVCVPFHSVRDVISLRKLSWPILSNIFSGSLTNTVISGFQNSYPNLSVVDTIEIGNNSVALVANDSSIRTLSCGVESRLFICTGSSQPRLVLGRSLFSLDNSLSISPSTSDLIYPSLGLVLAPLLHFNQSLTDSQSANLYFYSIDYTTTSMYCSSDCSSALAPIGAIVHRDHDLVPLLVHHMDYSQTLIYSSRVDHSIIYLPDVSFVSDSSFQASS